MLGIHLGLHGEKTVHQLLLGHFQTENGHCFCLFKSHILGNIEDEGSFSHGRPCGHQNEVGRLHTGRPVIQVKKPCCHPRHIPFIVGRFLDTVHGIHDDLPDRHELSCIPALYQVEDAFLRVGQNILQTFLAHVAGIGNLLIDADQSAQSGFLRHDIGIMLDVGRRRNRRDQIADEFQTAHLRRHILFFQPVLQCDQIYRFALVVELYHRVKDHAVLFVIKIITKDDL